MTHVANELGVWRTKISRLERGITRNPDLEARYRNWLNTQKAA